MSEKEKQEIIEALAEVLKEARPKNGRDSKLIVLLLMCIGTLLSNAYATWVVTPDKFDRSVYELKRDQKLGTVDVLLILNQTVNDNMQSAVDDSVARPFQKRQLINSAKTIDELLAKRKGIETSIYPMPFESATRSDK